MLRQFADLTGGAFYDIPNLSAIGEIVRIVRLIGSQECKITYQAQCQDGGFRRVDMSVINFCGGQDTKTKTYKAPKDTSTYTNVRLRTGSVSTLGGDTVLVPVLLGDTLHGLMYNSTASFSYEASVMQIIDAQAPAGALLAGTPMTVTPGGGTVVIQTQMQIPIMINNASTSAPLYYLRFRVPGHFGKDTTQHLVQFFSWVFEAGCLRALPASGEMSIIGKGPKVYYDFLPEFCEGTSMLLRAMPGVSNYRWSTGEATSVINIVKGGPFWYTASDSLGQQLRSDTLQVRMRPSPKPQLTLTDTVWLCLGDTARISTVASWSTYLWSDNSIGNAILVSSPGEYSVRVTDSFGCEGNSETVHARSKTLASPSIGGPRQSCVSADEIYSADSIAGRTFRWLIAGGSIAGRADQAAVHVHWNDGSSGRVMLDVSEGRCIAYGEATVALGNSGKPAISGIATVCEGETASYSVPASIGHNYSWTAQDGSIIGRSDSAAVTVVWRRSGVNRLLLLETNPPCSASDTMDVTVTPSAHVQLTANGSLTFCHGDSVLLDAGPGFTSYRWSNGDTTRVIVARGTGAYFARVSRPGSCDGSSDTVQVIELPAPQRPSITQKGNVLSADSSRAYQWFRSGTPISGATARTLAISSSGSYVVRTFDLNGCAAMSDSMDAIFTGIILAQQRTPSIDWYPRPVHGDFTLRLGDASVPVAMVTITDLLGRIMYRQDFPSGQRGEFSIPFSLPPAVVYLLAVDAGGIRRMSTLVKTR